MNITLRLFTISTSAIVFFSVIYMLVKRYLNESNSILWLFIGFFTFVSGFFPGIINHVAFLLGIDYPPALLFLLAILVLLMIVFKSSMEISRIQAQVTEIAITLSLVREENKRLNAMLSESERESALNTSKN